MIPKTYQKEIIQLYTDGLSVPKISQKISFSIDQIYGILQRNNIKRRNHAERFRLSSPSFRFIKPKTLQDNLLLVAYNGSLRPDNFLGKLR